MYKLSRIQRSLFQLIPKFILRRIIALLPGFEFIKETRNTQTPISFDIWYNHKIKGPYNTCYWPVHPTSLVQYSENIYCGIETCPGYSPGNYISAMGKIYIGDYTQIAPNVGLISGNHLLTDNRHYDIKDIHIGKYCWIGMGAIVLQGVTLGDYTVVAAGSIVTKSFEEGYSVIAGNPAKKIKTLVKEECVLHESEFKYNGYIKHAEFNEFKNKYLNV